MGLIDLVDEKIIKVPLTSANKPDTLREMAQILKDADEIEDLDAVLDALQQRESKGSTGITDAIAIPHCKTPAVTSLKLAIGISPEGIDFDSLDGSPSKLFFLLAAPPDQSGPHVEALAEIAKLAQSPAMRSALINARDSSEVVNLLKET